MFFKSMRKVFDEVCDIPILRPLIGHDKVEIERVARQAGTFDISTLPSLCCTIVPEKPATAASLPQVEKWEAQLPLEEMVDDSVSGLVQVLGASTCCAPARTRPRSS